MLDALTLSGSVTGIPAGAWAVAKAFQAVAYGTRPKPRRGKAREFRFESAFDTNGILHHIGTRGGTAAYRNPHELGEVVSSSSSLSVMGAVERFVQHAHAAPVSNFTSNVPESWLAVDLGEGRSLVVDHYCLRSDAHHGGLKLRNWELQGSLDGQTWQTLRAHKRDASLSSRSMGTAAWPVDAGAQAFRHFRIQQMNVNSSGKRHELTCTGIELYGRASFERPLA